MSTNVKIGVRCRPMSSKEASHGGVPCISMEGNVATIHPVNPNGKVRQYAVDHAFWGGGGSGQDVKGGVANTTVADQQHVYDVMGKPMVDDALSGIDTSLFVYGQLGSGKSYTLFGTSADEGVVPRFVRDLFSRVSESSATTEVLMSVCEIYQEKILDLLCPLDQQLSTVRTVKSHPKVGLYIENLTRYPVQEEENAMQKLDAALRNKALRSTVTNAFSHRGSLVISFSVAQVVKGSNTRLQSEVLFVDIAASDKAATTSTVVGERIFSEMYTIDHSMITLTFVIQSASDKAIGKLKKTAVVPFKDSLLTRLMEKSFTGKGKLSWLATVSNSSSSYDVSLFAFRLCERLKALKLNPVVNQVDVESLIEEIRQENGLYRSYVKGAPLPSTDLEGNAIDPNDPEVSATLRVAYQELIRSNQVLIRELKRSFTDRVEATEAADLHEQLQQIETSEPHLSNLNEDPMLTGRVMFGLKSGANKVGKFSAVGATDIVLSGLGIASNHCTITYEDSGVTISPGKGSRTFVNGEAVTVARRLQHNDRLLFGHYCFFVYSNGSDPIDPQLDWLVAISELQKSAVSTILGADDKIQSMRDKMNQINEELRKERIELATAKNVNQEATEKRKQTVNSFLEREASVKKDIAAQPNNQNFKSEEAKLSGEKQQVLAVADKEVTTTRNRYRSAEDNVARLESELVRTQTEINSMKMMEEQLIRTIMQVNEANGISDEMEKKVRLQVQIVPKINPMSRAINTRKGNSSVEILIKVDYVEASYVAVWDLERFLARTFLMRELYYLWSTLGNKFEYDETKDPFVDPVQEGRQIGHAHVYLESLGYLMEVVESVPVVDSKGKIQAELNITLTPKLRLDEEEEDTHKRHDDDEEEEEEEDTEELEDFDKIDDLVGKYLYVKVNIQSARGLPERTSRNVSCKYRLFNDEHIYKTPSSQKRTTDPEFNYEKWHKILVTPALAKSVWESALQVDVWGCVIEEKLSDIPGIIESLNSRVSAQRKFTN
eukprot:GILK01005718.1.p1 GENE.GILK01005718.1~~GILK01005718.1.p1  ORF type:complete len:1016 (+),score=245.98 GILK01005718.1:37-3048(+)